MANYSLVINSKFRPFEFSEMIQPVMIAEQAHRELEDAYGELAAKANIWDKMTNPETDKRAHSIYEAYARDLEKQAEELSKYGLTPTSRQSMIDMKGRYSKDITPIETAYKRRAEQAKQQAEIMAKDPTHFFARNAAETSLDRYLENPSLDTINQNYSGAVLAKQVSDEAAALAKAARNDPKVRTQLRHLLGFNYETIRQTGFSPEAVREAILRSPNASKELMNIVDNAMNSSGIADWDYVSPEEKQRIWNKALGYANQGLWSAVGQTQYGTVVDDAAKMAAEYNNAVRLAREKYKIEHPDTSTASGEPRRGWNFLEANGNLAAYKDMQSRFTTGNGALKASYFGNKNNGNKFVNPIEVYEEIIKAQNAARRTGTSLSERVKNRGKLSGTTLYQSGKTGGYDDTARIAAAGKAVRDRYGVTEVLSAEEYKHLKDLGYTRNSTYNDFRNDYSRKVNERASQFRHGSVNLNETALKERGNNLTGYLQFIVDRDNLKDKLWELNKDGSVGKTITSSSDIKDLIEKGNLTDVFYSRQAPDKIHVQYGGRDIYVTPSAFSNDVVSNIIKESNELLTASDAVILNYARRMGATGNYTAEDVRNVIAENTEAKLRDAMRAYNQGVPNTDSKLQ